MKTILVSAGHSDAQPGVSANGRREEVEAIKFRDAVAQQLRAMALKPRTDGNLGVNLPLREAIRLATRADLAVEFHFNAGPQSATGIEALSNIPSQSLAQALCAAIQRTTGLSLRKYQPGSKGWKPANGGQHSTLGFCSVGGVIVECCFLTNAHDLAAWDANVAATAKAVADVLREFAVGIRKLETRNSKL